MNDVGGRIRLGLFVSVLVIMNMQSVIEERSRTAPKVSLPEGYSGRDARGEEKVDAASSADADIPQEIPDQPASMGEFPSNSIEWGIDGPPKQGAEGYFEIWDITGSSTRKVVRLRPVRVENSQGTNFASPAATIYIEPGAKLRVPVIPGKYDVVAISGEQWNGRDFGEDTWAVSFGRKNVDQASITILAVGARDELARPAGRNEF